jgi:hypothetical protein
MPSASFSPSTARTTSVSKPVVIPARVQGKNTNTSRYQITALHGSSLVLERHSERITNEWVASLALFRHLISGRYGGTWSSASGLRAFPRQTNVSRHSYLFRVVGCFSLHTSSQSAPDRCLESHSQTRQRRQPQTRPPPCLQTSLRRQKCFHAAISFIPNLRFG